MERHDSYPQLSALSAEVTYNCPTFRTTRGPGDASAWDHCASPQPCRGGTAAARHFLELTFLAPGNAPAPVFDPTKAQSVLISSAGGLGRGGNVMIDGMDDNDDVVGGPLQNMTQDAVQEFQLITNQA